jgi:undecaprenyl-diphosphatase
MIISLPEISSAGRRSTVATVARDAIRRALSAKTAKAQNVNLLTLLQATLLGVVEGFTEFIPVSSTGHLILLVDLLGFKGPPGQSFEIVIQLGAILAVLVTYARTLKDVVAQAPADPDARRFIRALAFAFVPAAVIGGFAHDFIKSVLFSPWVVSIALVLGGIAILLIERYQSAPLHHRIADVKPGTSLGIGVFQTLAMIPGVSRSGATIMGALILKVDRSTATLFSFFLAIPTMLAATVFDLYKNRQNLDLSGSEVIAVGFVTAFVAAMVVVRWLIGFVGLHGFQSFAWYRIVLGLLMTGVLLLR